MSYRELFLSTEPSITNPPDVADPAVSVFGVPYDVTTSYRPGCRFGPNALRDAFWKIEVYDPLLDMDGEKVPVRDLGNLHPMPSPEEMTEAVRKITAELLEEGATPALLGGEHSLTYGSFRAMPEDVDLLIFDAHFDLRDELYGWKLSHGTFLRRLSERYGTKRFIHVGGRAASKDEWAMAEGMKSIFSRDMVSPGYVDGFRGLLKGVERLYVSVDLDVMDPAYAPGVGTPEPGGISSAALLQMLRELRGKELVGFDIVELDPAYDHSGITAIAAASVFSTLAGLVGAAKSSRGS
ncbi:MAG: agmatinase [Nitrososphaerota archaeon]|nr:agmatinase [Nitrososphaerota archaeon]MDG6939785.1 agmatinase [Nitrososphaerota archaeon]